MTEDNFEKLAKRWPALFQKSGDFEFSIGDGWYNIVDILCGYISYDVESLQRRLKYAMENPKYAETIPALEQKLKEELENLPTLVQVKEKFGTMRFYVDGGTTKIHNYISFAEGMTSRTCEECGAPGESRNGGWVKVLCDKHHREREEKDNPGFYPARSSKTEPKLSDET